MMKRIIVPLFVVCWVSMLLVDILAEDINPNLNRTTEKPQNVSSQFQRNSTKSQKPSALKVDTCIGKIRTITGVDPNFRENIDRLAQTAQYDEIDKMLRNKEEIAATTAFLDEEKQSTQIAQLVARNMTHEERDRVNMLENTNNLAGLRDFYLNKYQSLPREQYEMLRKSYNKVLSKFANSNLKENIAQFLNALTPNDSTKLKAYGMVSEESKLVAFIDKKLSAANFTEADRSEIERYMKGLFMSLKLD